MKALFKDDQASAKHNTREYLYNQLHELHKYKPKLLTLPASNFIFESMVLNQYPYASINCMEYNQELYNTVCQNVDDQKFNYQYGDIFDKIHANPYTYDMVWMDLCGNLTPYNINNLISVIQNTLKDRCIVAFTFSAYREVKLSQLLHLYKCASLTEFRFDFFPKLLVRMGKLVHPDFKLDNLIQYKNSKGVGAPMCMYVFKTY
jgi:hypothetical protein